MIDTGFGKAGSGKNITIEAQRKEYVYNAEKQYLINTIHSIENDIIRTAINPFKPQKKKLIEYYLLAYRYYLEELDKLEV